MFKSEGTISLTDLFQPGFQPSRALGPAMPDSPEETWLRGMPAAPPQDTRMAEGSPAQVAQIPLPEAPLGAAWQSPPEPVIGDFGDVILLELGVARFGGKDIALNAEEIDAISRHLIDAYSRVQSEERFSLICKYLQPKSVEGGPMHEPSGAGEEVVPEMYRAQEEGDLSPEEMQELREAMFGGPSEVREVPSSQPGSDAAAPDPQHKVPRRNARRKTKS